MVSETIIIIIGNVFFGQYDINRNWPMRLTTVQRKKRHEGDTVFVVESKKARYTATLVACGWAGAVFEVT